MAAIDAVLADLAAEGDDLDQLVSRIEPDRWQTETPSPGWTIAHQIGHLAWSDRFTVLAMTDPAAFGSRRTEAAGDFDATTDAAAAVAAVLPPGELLLEWRGSRAAVLARAGGGAAGAEGAVARRPDGPGQPGQYPADGTGRARAGHQGCARGELAADRPHRAPGQAGVPDQGFRVCLSRPAAPGQRVPSRAHLARRGAVDVRTGGCSAAGDWSGGGLLLAGHPSAAPARICDCAQRARTPTSGLTSPRRTRVRRPLAASRASFGRPDNLVALVLVPQREWAGY